MPHLCSLQLQDFRNYAALHLRLDARPVVLTGGNGAGKTNILEAVSLLIPGRGLRRAAYSDMDRQETEDPPVRQPWTVFAEAVTVDGTVAIGTARDTSGTADRRRVHVDGQPVRSQEALTRHMAVVWITPAMDGLFREGETGRRQFLDRLTFTFEPGHAASVSAYERAMRERNRVLTASPRPDPAWLTALEQRMAQEGVAIAAARARALARLQAHGNRNGSDGSNGTSPGAFPGFTATLQGDLDHWLREGTPEDAEPRLREALQAGRARDQAAGRTLSAGPHRSALHVLHTPKAMPAAQCSTGEQKALLLALVLASVRARQEASPPLLLLDEVVAHLDAARRAALLHQHLDLRVQAWLTGTDAEAFTPLAGKAQFLAVGEGGVGAGD